MGITNQNDSVPARGERVAAYVETYMAAHRGLSVGELAFRLRVDKRDLGRLLRDRSCGWRLEDSLAAYFGPDFVDAVFAAVLGSGPSIREQELERERAEIHARHAQLRARRSGRPMAAGAPGLRVVDDRSGEARV